MAGHFPWVLVWTGACYWHGVGGFMFNSPSSPRAALHAQRAVKWKVALRTGSRISSTTRVRFVVRCCSNRHHRRQRAARDRARAVGTPRRVPRALPGGGAARIGDPTPARRLDRRVEQSGGLLGRRTGAGAAGGRWRGGGTGEGARSVLEAAARARKRHRRKHRSRIDRSSRARSLGDSDCVRSFVFAMVVPTEPAAR